MHRSAYSVVVKFFFFFYSRRDSRHTVGIALLQGERSSHSGHNKHRFKKDTIYIKYFKNYLQKLHFHEEKRNALTINTQV